MAIAVAAPVARSSNVRWLLLLLASYTFYTLWQPEPLLLLIACTLVTYACARGMGAGKPARRGLLVVGIVFNLGMLFVFKYADFFLGSLHGPLQRLGWAGDGWVPELKLLLPVGLSFYTFSAISYLADVYMGRIEPERHLGRFAVYVAFFPKIFAGPIERAGTFLAQLRSKVQIAPEHVTEGLQLCLWGLFKKVIIADRLAVPVDAAYSSTAFAPTVTLVIAVYFYAFQIYCDFSGYTDMARGVARLLGFDLVENFRRSYLAKSPGEFWARRWHLSLCTWFRDYVYIPMGGSRVSRTRHYFNLLLVFALSGLWHGANWTFVVWGFLNGLYVCAGAATGRLWRAVGERLTRLGKSGAWGFVRVLFTFHLIAFAWIFFRASTLGDAWTVIRRIGSSWSDLPTLFASYAWPAEILLSIALIAFLIGFELLDERKSVWDRLRAMPVVVRWSFYYLLIFGLVILGKWQFSQFIYMQF